MFKRAVAHLSAHAGHSKPPCSVLSMCALNQHRRRVQSCKQRALAQRARARSPQTHQAAAIHKTQRGSRHLTIGHLVERVVVRIARSSLPVEELELVAPLADHCYAHAVRALPPAQTTLLRSCQLSDSSRCFVRPAGFGVHWSSCRRFATMAEPSGGSRARATRCSAASSGTMYRVASGATSIVSFAWDIRTRDARRLGQMTVTSFAWDRCKKDRNDSFYNLPPPNSLNRRGVAILTLHPRPGVGSLGAHVGRLSSRCDAAALGADRAGHLRARRYYYSLISPSAFMPYYSGRPPGHGHRRCACAGGSRLTPGGGQVMPRARGLLGVLGAAPPAICRRESVPRRVWEPLQAPLRPRASPQAPPTPVEELPRARQVIRVPRRPRNGQGAATRCLWLAQMAGPGRPEGWLQTFSLF